MWVSHMQTQKTRMRTLQTQKRISEKTKRSEKRKMCVWFICVCGSYVRAVHMCVWLTGRSVEALTGHVGHECHVPRLGVLDLLLLSRSEQLLLPLPLPVPLPLLVPLHLLCCQLSRAQKLIWGGGGGRGGRRGGKRCCS